MVRARRLLARDRTWTSAAALPYPTARGINRDARADLAGTTNLIAAPRVHSIVVSGSRVAAIPGVFGSAVALCSANFFRRRSMTSRSTMASGSAPPIRRPTPFRLRSVAMTRLDFDQGLPSTSALSANLAWRQDGRARPFAPVRSTKSVGLLRQPAGGDPDGFHDLHQVAAALRKVEDLLVERGMDICMSPYGSGRSSVRSSLRRSAAKRVRRLSRSPVYQEPDRPTRRRCLPASKSFDRSRFDRAKLIQVSSS